jgi:hypothetical protein
VKGILIVELLFTVLQVSISLGLNLSFDEIFVADL